MAPPWRHAFTLAVLCLLAGTAVAEEAWGVAAGAGAGREQEEHTVRFSIELHPSAGYSGTGLLDELAKETVQVSLADVADASLEDVEVTDSSMRSRVFGYMHLSGSDDAVSQLREQWAGASARLAEAFARLVGAEPEETRLELVDGRMEGELTLQVDAMLTGEDTQTEQRAQRLVEQVCEGGSLRAALKGIGFDFDAIKFEGTDVFQHADVSVMMRQGSLKAAEALVDNVAGFIESEGLTERLKLSGLSAVASMPDEVERRSLVVHHSCTALNTTAPFPPASPNADVDPLCPPPAPPKNRPSRAVVSYVFTGALVQQLTPGAANTIFNQVAANSNFTKSEVTTVLSYVMTHSVQLTSAKVTVSGFIAGVAAYLGVSAASVKATLTPVAAGRHLLGPPAASTVVYNVSFPTGTAMANGMAAVSPSNITATTAMWTALQQATGNPNVYIINTAAPAPSVVAKVVITSTHDRVATFQPSAFSNAAVAAVVSTTPYAALGLTVAQQQPPKIAVRAPPPPVVIRRPSPPRPPRSPPPSPKPVLSNSTSSSSSSGLSKYRRDALVGGLVGGVGGACVIALCVFIYARNSREKPANTATYAPTPM